MLRKPVRLLVFIRAMSPEENKALVRRYYEEIDRGNVDAMDDLVAEDYVNHAPPPFPIPDGREGVKEMLKILWEATPGRHVIEDQIAEGDRVVTRITAEGKHEGDLPGGIKATGNDMNVSAVVIHRIESGKLAEHWSGRDDVALMQQIGVLPPMQGP